MMPRAVLDGIFSGNMPNLDVQAAIDELREAGFHVLKMPARFHEMTCVAGDCFLEIYWFIPVEDINEDGIPRDDERRWADADHICSKYGGYADGLGLVGPDHVPFADLFKPPGPPPKAPFDNDNNPLDPLA
jgi:hypothetical protein